MNPTSVTAAPARRHSAVPAASCPLTGRSPRPIFPENLRGDAVTRLANDLFRVSASAQRANH
jgi:hypothetical protein